MKRAPPAGRRGGAAYSRLGHADLRSRERSRSSIPARRRPARHPRGGRQEGRQGAHLPADQGGSPGSVRASPSGSRPSGSRTAADPRARHSHPPGRGGAHRRRDQAARPAAGHCCSSTAPSAPRTAASAACPSRTLQELHTRYGGRVFAFDHPTVSRAPRRRTSPGSPTDSRARTSARRRRGQPLARRPAWPGHGRAARSWGRATT